MIWFLFGRRRGRGHPWLFILLVALLVGATMAGAWLGALLLAMALAGWFMLALGRAAARADEQDRLSLAAARRDAELEEDSRG